MAERFLPVVPTTRHHHWPCWMDRCKEGSASQAGKRSRTESDLLVSPFIRCEKTRIRYFTPATKLGWLVEDLLLHEMLGYKSI